MRCWYEHKPEWERADTPGLITLAEDFTFYIQHEKKTTEYCVPSLIYSYDGASIPRIFWNIVGSPFDPKNLEAASVHDPFYLVHAVPRWMADEAAFQLWLPLTGLAGARVRWSAVRTGGYFSWKNSAADRSEIAKIRAILEKRPDRAKFNSLWFAPSCD